MIYRYVFSYLLISPTRKHIFLFLSRWRFSPYRQHSWCFSILNWVWYFHPHQIGLTYHCCKLLAGLMIGIEMSCFQYLIQSYETEHQLNQQHHINHCLYFQWLVIKTVSGCTSQKMLLQIHHTHFVCQNPAYKHLFYTCCNLV